MKTCENCQHKMRGSGEDGSVCDCFPAHCEKFEEHGECWCSPEVIEVDGNKVFIHREEQ